MDFLISMCTVNIYSIFNSSLFSPNIFEKIYQKNLMILTRISTAEVLEEKSLSYNSPVYDIYESLEEMCSRSRSEFLELQMIC